MKRSELGAALAAAAVSIGIIAVGLRDCARQPSRAPIPTPDERALEARFIRDPTDLAALATHVRAFGFQCPAASSAYFRGAEHRGNVTELHCVVGAKQLTYRMIATPGGGVLVEPKE